MWVFIESNEKFLTYQKDKYTLAEVAVFAVCCPLTALAQNTQETLALLINNRVISDYWSVFTQRES